MNILESTKLAVAMCSLLFCTTVLGVFGLMMAWELLLQGIMRLRRLPPRWVQQLLVLASWPLPDSIAFYKAAYFMVEDPPSDLVKIKFGIGGSGYKPLVSVFFLDSSGHWWTRDACSRHFTRAAAERAAVAMLMGGEP